MDSPRQQLNNIDDKQISKALLLPPELIYIIARQMSRNRDLLAFGLVHSSFHDVVVPYYLRFREVIMRVDDLNMWSYLAGDNQSLANVEVLRIVFGYGGWRKGPQPPLPKTAVQTLVQAEVDPLDQMQRSLEGMKRLREVSWDDSYWVPKPPKEGEPGTNECRQKFWSVVPRLCKGVQTINLLLRPRNENDYCWLCGPLLSELHHAGNLRAFTGDLFTCDHSELDALITQARTTQNNIFTAFTGLRELNLKETRLQVLPDLQFPSLITLSLVNVEFEASDGLLRLLESSPGIISLHLDDDGSSMLGQDGGSASSLAIAPLLKSFRGHYGDAEILFFNPLPDGRSRSISNLEVEGSSAEVLLPSLITAFKHAKIGAREDLLALKIHTTFDWEYYPDREENEFGLLWVSWLRSIVTYCPKLRGLFIEIDDPDAEPNSGDETDGWKPTLAPLKDLAVLKLPASLWAAEVSQGGQEGEAERRVVEQCLQWFPRLRLFFPSDHLVLIINAEENEAETPPTRGRLLDSGQATGRRWNLYEHLFPVDFEEVAKGLIA